MSSILENSELIPGKILSIDTLYKTIYYLIIREKNNASISNLDIYDTLNSRKNAGIIEGYGFIALSVKNLINAELH